MNLFDNFIHLLPEAITSPVALNATEQTMPVWPVNYRTSFLVLKSHSLIVLSYEANFSFIS